MQVSTYYDNNIHNSIYGPGWPIPRQRDTNFPKKHSISSIYELRCCRNVLINDSVILSRLDHGCRKSTQFINDNQFQRILLLASFFATLLAFMMGLYVIMYPIKSWIAFLALGLCSLTVLLARKFLVLKLLVPFGKICTIFIWRLVQNSVLLIP